MSQQQAPSPDLFQQCLMEMATAITHVGLMKEHLRQMNANLENEDQAELYKKAAVSQATQAANLLSNTHANLVGFIEAFADRPRIARV